MLLIFVGSLIFGYGLLGMRNGDTIFTWLTSTVRLTITLRGVADVAAYLTAKRMEEERKRTTPNQQQHDS